MNVCQYSTSIDTFYYLSNQNTFYAITIASFVHGANVILFTSLILHLLIAVYYAQWSQSFI